MRRVLPYDVEQAARSLQGYPEADWPFLCRSWIIKADIAHRYFKRIGKAHPLWGRGALADVVLGKGDGVVGCRFSACEVVFRCLAEHQERLA